MPHADLRHTFPRRLLLGPGPSPVSPSVLQAQMAGAGLGHLDPVFLNAMSEVRTMLARAFGATSDETCLVASATGSGGMEMLVANLVSPGDRVLACVNGVFGARIAECARRHGAEVDVLSIPMGQAVSADRVRAACVGHSYDLISLVHAETSTGVLSPFEGLREVADSAGALLLVDSVTSLGGVPIEFSRYGVDASFSGSQKCLSVPPGLSPIALSERALQRIRRRKSPVASWYFDLELILAYWGEGRVYHHTAPVGLLLALHESLRAFEREGANNVWRRHADNAAALRRTLLDMHLTPVDVEFELSPLTPVSIPKGITDTAFRAQLLRDHSIEIGGGLGEWKGRVWRIGLMGEGSKQVHIEQLRQALVAVLNHQGG